MKKILLKELIIMFFSIIVGVLLFIYSFGLNNLTLGSTLYLNIHDTIFVIPSISILLIGLTFISLVFYSIRVVIFRFKSFVQNMILLMITGLMIFAMTKVILFSQSMIDLTNNYNNELIKADYNRFSKIMSYFQVGLIIYFGVVGFISGMKKNTVL